MGWYCGYPTKRGMIEEQLKGWEGHDKDGKLVRKTEFIAHCWRGNNFSGVLWAVGENSWTDGRPAQRFIMSWIMNRTGGEWGYKPVGEDMGPCECSCPLSYLDMVPEVPQPYGAAGRERVRTYHAIRNKPVALGETWELTPGCNPHRLTIVNLRPLRGADEYGNIYRVTKKLLAEQVVVADTVAQGKGE